ncbi:DUF2798 domain-containing protein [Caldimonas tepidiphila]|uniref:DUF2798 domain-containing protein n=1 Tax=Caldimonas tepidiphila TaxID=2315841 RepID=UPI001F0BA349|nr:DUF2798 domain-containing protein [Caldimonas tepidiphila]
MSNESQTPNQRRARRKLPHRFAPVAFAFYMAGIVAFMMSLVLTALNGGIGPDYAWRVLRAYLYALPVGFGCVMLVRPLVLRLVALTVEPPGRP